METVSGWLSKTIREKFPDGVKELSPLSQAELLRFLLKRAEYTGPQGIEGRQGIQGEKGETGAIPKHEWDGTRLRFELPSGEWGPWVDLVGDEPKHEWQGTKLRFQNPDGTWGEWMDLEGKQGLPPEHQWLGTKLRFKNPDGVWGDWKELLGKQGRDGPQGIPGKDGRDGKDGARGPKGEKGNPGKDGRDGKDGETGKPPKHQWDGKKIRFENPDGSWGPWVDIQGRPGLVQYLAGGSNVGEPTEGDLILIKVAGEVIPAIKAVYASSPGFVFLGQKTDAAKATILGISKTAAAFVGNVLEVITFGEFEDASLNFPVDDILFLTDNGGITNAAPSGPYLTRLGYSMGAGKIFINIEPAKKRA